MSLMSSIDCFVYLELSSEIIILRAESMENWFGVTTQAYLVKKHERSQMKTYNQISCHSQNPIRICRGRDVRDKRYLIVRYVADFGSSFAGDVRNALRF